MSYRKTRVDNGFLIASTCAHIGEALDAPHQDFDDSPSLIQHTRKISLDFFEEAGRRVVVCFTAFYRRVHHTLRKGLK